MSEMFVSIDRCGMFVGIDEVWWLAIPRWARVAMVAAPIAMFGMAAFCAMRLPRSWAMHYSGSI